ncbi:MAG: 5'-nucleotidase C-terminal domain-containing protein [Halanaerobium sp.]
MKFLQKMIISILIIIILSAAGVEAAAEKLNFTILHTNDEHSSLIPHSPAVDYQPGSTDPKNDQTRGGFARLAAAVKKIRKEKEKAGEEILLLSAGDFLGGSPFAWLALEGEAAELKLMQKLGYQAAVLGNHEFDYGAERLAEYLKEADYPKAHSDLSILASNLKAPANSPFTEDNLYQEKKIIEMDNGLKIGIFGLQGEDSAALIKDSGNLTFNNSIKTAEKMTSELEDEVDLIIALTHSGIKEDLKLASELPEIDIIIGGHSHLKLQEVIESGQTIIAQAGSKLEFLGRLDLSYDLETEKLELQKEQSGLLKLNAEIEADPEMENLVDNYKDKFNSQITKITNYEHYLEPVAESDFVIRAGPPLSESPAGNFITDAMRLMSEKITGENVDIAVKTNGSIRKNIVPGRNGKISFYELAETVGLGKGKDAYPGYPVITGYLSGREVKELLELAVLAEEFAGNSSFLQFSGLRYDYDPAAAVLTTLPVSNQPLPSLEAVENAEIYNGAGVQDKDGDDYKAIYDDQLYKIVTDSYLIDYLPYVNNLIPQLNIIPKNESGEPLLIDNRKQFKIFHAGSRELKVWETVVDFAAEQKNNEGKAQIPDYYQNQRSRINQVKIPEANPLSIRGGSLHSFTHNNLAENSDLDLSFLEGYRIAAVYKLNQLSSLAVSYNYLSAQDKKAEHQEGIELQGVNFNYSYNLSRLLKAAGYNLFFDLKPKLGSGYYMGEYNLADNSYQASNLAFNLGLEAEKNLADDFKLTGEFNYRFLKLDFESRAQSQSLNKELDSLDFSLGLLYQF